MNKKLQILLSSTVLCSTLAIAGGGVVPVEEMEVAPIITEANGLYLGLGLSSMRLDNDFNGEEFSTKAITLQAGYQFNTHLAIEGRYTKNVGDLDYDHGTSPNPDYDNYPGDFTNIAIYLKPSYTFSDFSVYALLGYGEVLKTDLPDPKYPGSVDRAEAGFQWGLGATYAITDEVSVFADYVNAYDDKGFDYRAQLADIKADLWTLGVTYRF